MLAAIVSFSIRFRGVIAGLATALLVYGLYDLSRAGLDIFPEFAPKLVIVQTEAPGLYAEQVEQLVTRPIENAVGGIIGLEYVRSESIQGLSIVTAVFGDDTDIWRNRQLVTERLADAAGELPPGAGPPLAVPLSSSSATILTVGLTSPSRSLMELRTLVDWTIVPRILSVPGVADVNVFGGDIEQLQIQVQPEKLRRYALGIEDVTQAAQQATGVQGVGFIENANQRLTLRPLGQPVTPEQLEGVVLARKDGANVTLGDVATVTRGAAPPIGAAQIGGAPGIVLMVIGQYGANTLTVSQAVEDALRDFDAILASQDIRFHPDLFRPANYIETSLHNIAGHLLVGGAFVVAVLALFLFNLRTAFISALAIPLSLLSAVIVLLEAGVNLNVMVLGGLAIALGEVVDDAIIDTENIYRRLRENARLPEPRPVARVVFDASMEVRASVVYASFIVALVFVPLLTLGGVAGRLFSPLGQAYILTILMSLGVALTVTPALCYLLLAHGRLPEQSPPLIRRLQPGYASALRRSGATPRLSIVLALLVCAAGLALVPFLRGRFLPELREGHYIVHTASLPGTSLQESIRVGTRLTEQFSTIPGVRSVSQWAGRAERGADTYGSHYSEYEVDLVPMSGSGQQRVIDSLRDVLEAFPGISYEANTFLVERVDETISGYTAPVVVNVYGDDLDELDRTARAVAEVMKDVPGATDVQLRSPTGTPLLQVRLQLDRLASWGLRPMQVIDAMQVAYEGRVVGRSYQDERVIDVAVVLDPEERQRPGDVAELPLRTPDGVLVPLGRIADIRETAGRYNILHRGAQRVQTVTCNVAERDLGEFMKELEKRVLDQVSFSTRVFPEFTGAGVERARAREDLVVHSLLAGVGVLVLVYVAIGSVRNVMLMLLNLPFSLVGGVVAALVTGGTMSVGSMVGFVTLFGITVRNSIMLVSHYRYLVEVDGLPWNMDTAVRGAQERLPSILMTALVTALAMLPIAVDSDNAGREIMGPMAAIIIGGLVSSTVLNLLVLPSVILHYGRFGGSDGIGARELLSRENA
jgi:CzcA family heavy metal efflux pump